ncbi:ABC transporter-related protein [Leptothrix cholodnii SP-6]|uniref:ABC transporter-related protein n=1 Tax=Leptothrix cholodnii (strain ATCC 51168 / LMG 8142 / SP-6) TaxID=395495 RepID=B1XZB2_LEPCP|nr:ABC transporter ATP-binding protein [Leptothrix cholodnii]ACB35282.1 ABC transporter-related protein [Leptothrix cholodnii SP-6]
MSELIPPPVEVTGAARVEMMGFSKRFGALQALDDVSLTVEAGSFHALLGENGAGKSTLVKALIGFYQADTGSVSVDGRERAIGSPRDAAALGLGMIFQHFTVVPGMTVAENLALAGRDLTALIDWKAERARLAAFMRTAPFPLALDARVAELAAGEKQKLEILKALYARRRFLVLDEPTSVLTPQEADEVLGRVKALCREGQLSVLIITHKFREVFGFCDEVTVLRRGRRTGGTRVVDTSRDQLASWMMGVPHDAAGPTGEVLPSALVAELVGVDAPVAAVTPVAPEAATPAASAPRLRIDALTVLGHAGQSAIDRLRLQVMPGEIVGVAGVSGNGQRELVAALTGTLPIAGGSVFVDGQPYAPTRAQMLALGVRSLPEEPLQNACVGKLSVAENLALRNFDRAPLAAGLWLRRSAMRRQALAHIANFKVKTPGPDAPIETLSGGNVQRAVLARELSHDQAGGPRVLIVANPCFGLDFQATAEIHARLRAARDAGCGVLLVSEDLDEILALASRLVVLSHGRVALECTTATADIARIGHAMAGEGAHDSHPVPSTAEAA